MTTPGGTLGQSTQDMQKAIGEFEGASGEMSRIHDSVDEAIQKLVGQAMVSLSGQSYGKAVAQWLSDFNDIKAQLDAMTQTLQVTVQGFNNNEAHNANLVSGIINPGGAH
jgi:uncharacterized protein YukE